MRALAGLALLAAGCGRVWYDPLAAARVDAGSADSGARDAAMDAPAPDAGADAAVMDALAMDRAIEDAAADAAPDAGGEPDAPSDASERDAGTGTDASIPTVVCDWRRGVVPGPIRHLGAASTLGPDVGPFVTEDGRELFFIAGGLGTQEIRISRRPTAADPFPSSGRLGMLTVPPGTMALSRFEMSRDRLEAFLSASAVPDPTGFDIWRAWRAMAAAPFTLPTVAADLSTAETDGEPHLCADGVTMWMSLGWGRPGGTGGVDLFHASRAAAGSPFGAPMGATELNTSAHEYFASLTADQRTIVFTTTRAGNPDVFYATRDDPAGPFGLPDPIPAVTTGGSEQTPFVTLDGCTLYYSANRPDSIGDLDLYAVDLTPM